jgi:Domain of unknown function (DUF4291)
MVHGGGPTEHHDGAWLIHLAIESYLTQSGRWPPAGRVILAQFDADSVVVYQAYSESIGRFAATHGYFGGNFKLGRMTWIKPNFLWMMYRSGWGTKVGQEITLAIRLKRAAFDTILAEAVPSSFDRRLFSTEDEWKRQVADSDVRLQWDPDHDPQGKPLQRRAIQLGLRGDAIARFARDWIVSIEDISPFVAEERAHARDCANAALSTPREMPYPVGEPAVAARLGLSQSD